MGMLNELTQNNCVDEGRIYLGGLSMGAFGILEWMAREPNKFAAAFPICGGGINYLRQYMDLKYLLGSFMEMTTKLCHPVIQEI